MPPKMPDPGNLNDDCDEVMNGLADGSVRKSTDPTQAKEGIYIVKDSMKMETQVGNSVLKMLLIVSSNHMSQVHGEHQVLTVSHSISEERMLLLVRYV